MPLNPFDPGPAGTFFPGAGSNPAPFATNVGLSGYAQNNYGLGWNPSLVGTQISPGAYYGGRAGQAVAQQNQANAAAAQTYQSALQQAQQDYGNLVNSYQRQLGLIDSSNQSIQSAYTQLLNQLIGGVAGTEGPARQSIYDDYLRNLGSQRQSLVSRGLNNTTVRDSVERGVLSDKWRRDNELSASMAQLVAGYERDIGLAGLGAQREAQQQRNALDFQYTQLRQQADQYSRNLEQQYRLALLGRSGGGGGGGGGGGSRSPLGPVSSIGGAPSAPGTLIPEGGYANNFGFGGGGGGYYSPPVNYGQTIDLWGGGNFSDYGGTYLGGYGPFQAPTDYFGNSVWPEGIGF